MGAEPGVLDHGVAHEAAYPPIPVGEGVNVIEAVMGGCDGEDSPGRAQFGVGVSFRNPLHEGLYAFTRGRLVAPHHDVLSGIVAEPARRHEE
jgi:hypothetical protein